MLKAFKTCMPQASISQVHVMGSQWCILLLREVGPNYTRSLPYPFPTPLSPRPWGSAPDLLSWEWNFAGCIQPRTLGLRLLRDERVIMESKFWSTNDYSKIWISNQTHTVGSNQGNRCVSQFNTATLITILDASPKWMERESSLRTFKSNVYSR